MNIMIDFLKGKIKNPQKNIFQSFKFLPPDKYEKSKGYYFRFRNFSKIIIKNKIVDHLTDTKFFQNKKINRYAGGIKRKFSPIKKNIKFLMVKLFKENFHSLIRYKNAEVGFHQLRIKCGKDFVGYPVPEGWHKDGFDYVILLNFGSKNIKGGVTRIKEKIDQNNDTFSAFLKKGEYLFVNDKKYYHYTDPINVSNNIGKGSRDTLVITIKIIN